MSLKELISGDSCASCYRHLLVALDIWSVVQYDPVVIAGAAQFFLGQISQLIAHDLSGLLDWV